LKKGYHQKIFSQALNGKICDLTLKERYSFAVKTLSDNNQLIKQGSLLVKAKCKYRANHPLATDD